MNARLKAAREASGKTQKQIAEKMGIAEAAYQRYEYGKNTPNVLTAIRIADALGVKSYKQFKALFGAAIPDE